MKIVLAIQNYDKTQKQAFSLITQADFST